VGIGAVVGVSQLFSSNMLFPFILGR